VGNKDLDIIEGDYRGGATTEGLSVVERLCESFQHCETPKDLALVIEGFQATPEQVEDAIASQDTQPKRQQLSQWYVAAKVGDEAKVKRCYEIGAEPNDSAPISLRPSLSDYQPGQEVWAYFPQSQDRWLKATVEWVRENLVKVKSGFLGIFIEQEDAIAPGDWVMSG
jgi:hypothetical protein